MRSSRFESEGFTICICKSWMQFYSFMNANLFSGMFPILLPKLLAMAAFRGFDVTPYTFDTEFEDESSDRIESELRNEQLFTYVQYDDILKGATSEKKEMKEIVVRARAVAVRCTCFSFTCAHDRLPRLFVPFFDSFG